MEDSKRPIVVTCSNTVRERVWFRTSVLWTLWRQVLPFYTGHKEPTFWDYDVLSVIRCIYAMGTLAAVTCALLYGLRLPSDWNYAAYLYTSMAFYILYMLLYMCLACLLTTAIQDIALGLTICLQSYCFTMMLVYSIILFVVALLVNQKAYDDNASKFQISVYILWGLTWWLPVYVVIVLIVWLVTHALYWMFCCRRCTNRDPHNIKVKLRTSMELAMDLENEPCCVCKRPITEMSGGVLGNCKHRYHSVCVRKTFKTHLFCPYCQHEGRKPQPIILLDSNYLFEGNSRVVRKIAREYPWIGETRSLFVLNDRLFYLQNARELFEVIFGRKTVLIPRATLLASLPGRVEDVSMVVFDSRLFLLRQTSEMCDLFVYSLATDAWTQLPPPRCWTQPIELSHHYLLLFNGVEEERLDLLDLEAGWLTKIHNIQQSDRARCYSINPWEVNIHSNDLPSKGAMLTQAWTYNLSQGTMKETKVQSMPRCSFFIHLPKRGLAISSMIALYVPRTKVLWPFESAM